MDYEYKPFSYNEEEEMDYEDNKPLYCYMYKIYGGFFTDYYVEKNDLKNRLITIVAKNTKPPLEHDFDEEGNYVPFPFSNLTFPKQFVKEVRLIIECRINADNTVTIRCPQYEELNRFVPEEFW